MKDLIKIAKERFETGHRIAYIPLMGDPDRTRNFAGIWIAENRAYYGVSLVGRLLGQNVETAVYSTDSIEDAVEHALIIWDSYKYD